MMKALSNKVTRSYHCFRSFKNLPFPPNKKPIVTRDKRDFKNSEVPDSRSEQIR